MTDRELDKAVAEKVMGLTKKKIERLAKKNYESCMKSQAGMGALGNEKWKKDCDRLKKEYFRDRQIPYYSTNSFAAWQVVERMRKLGWKGMVTWVREGYCAAFTTLVHLKGNEPYQESPSRAICLAALKAVEK